MKYVIFILGLTLLSCTVLDKERIKCINENYIDIPQNEDTKVLNDCFKSFLNDYLRYDSDIKYYFEDSIKAELKEIKIDKNSKCYKDIFELFPKIEEAIIDRKRNDIKKPSAISFCQLSSFIENNNLYPIGCNENFTVQDGWSIKVYKSGFSKDSTICCFFVSMDCGFMCYTTDLLIFQKQKSEWKMIKKISL